MRGISMSVPESLQVPCWSNLSAASISASSTACDLHVWNWHQDWILHFQAQTTDLMLLTLPHFTGRRFSKLPLSFIFIFSFSCTVCCFHFTNPGERHPEQEGGTFTFSLKCTPASWLKKDNRSWSTRVTQILGFKQWITFFNPKH